MRCLTLANALRDAGAICWFAGIADTLKAVPELARSGPYWIDVSAPGDACALLR